MLLPTIIQHIIRLFAHVQSQFLNGRRFYLPLPSSIGYKTVSIQICKPRGWTDISSCFATCGKNISTFSSIKKKKIKNPLINKHSPFNLKQTLEDSPLPLPLACLCELPHKTLHKLAKEFCLHTQKSEYSWPLTMGLNCTGPLIWGFFFQRIEYNMLGPPG